MRPLQGKGSFARAAKDGRFSTPGRRRRPNDTAMAWTTRWPRCMQADPRPTARGGRLHAQRTPTRLARAPAPPPPPRLAAQRPMSMDESAVWASGLSDRSGDSAVLSEFGIGGGGSVAGGLGEVGSSTMTAIALGWGGALPATPPVLGAAVSHDSVASASGGGWAGGRSPFAADRQPRAGGDGGTPGMEGLESMRMSVFAPAAAGHPRTASASEDVQVDDAALAGGDVTDVAGGASLPPGFPIQHPPTAPSAHPRVGSIAPTAVRPGAREAGPGHGSPPAGRNGGGVQSAVARAKAEGAAAMAVRAQRMAASSGFMAKRAPVHGAEAALRPPQPGGDRGAGVGAPAVLPHPPRSVGGTPATTRTVSAFNAALDALLESPQAAPADSPLRVPSPLDAVSSALTAAGGGSTAPPAPAPVLASAAISGGGARGVDAMNDSAAAWATTGAEGVEQRAGFGVSVDDADGSVSFVLSPDTRSGVVDAAAESSIHSARTYRPTAYAGTDGELPIGGRSAGGELLAAPALFVSHATPSTVNGSAAGHRVGSAAAARSSASAGGRSFPAAGQLNARDVATPTLLGDRSAFPSEPREAVDRTADSPLATPDGSFVATLLPFATPATRAGVAALATGGSEVVVGAEAQALLRRSLLMDPHAHELLFGAGRASLASVAGGGGARRGGGLATPATTSGSALPTPPSAGLMWLGESSLILEADGEDGGSDAGREGAPGADTSVEDGAGAAPAPVPAAASTTHHPPAPSAPPSSAVAAPGVGLAMTRPTAVPLEGLSWPAGSLHPVPAVPEVPEGDAEEEGEGSVSHAHSGLITSPATYAAVNRTLPEALSAAAAAAVEELEGERDAAADLLAAVPLWEGDSIDSAALQPMGAGPDDVPDEPAPTASTAGTSSQPATAAQWLLDASMRDGGEAGAGGRVAELAEGDTLDRTVEDVLASVHGAVGGQGTLSASPIGRGASDDGTRGAYTPHFLASRVASRPRPGDKGATSSRESASEPGKRGAATTPDATPASPPRSGIKPPSTGRWSVQGRRHPATADVEEGRMSDAGGSDSGGEGHREQIGHSDTSRVTVRSSRDPPNSAAPSHWSYRSGAGDHTHSALHSETTTVTVPVDMEHAIPPGTAVTLRHGHAGDGTHATGSRSGGTVAHTAVRPIRARHAHTSVTAAVLGGRTVSRRLLVGENDGAGGEEATAGPAQGGNAETAAGDGGSHPAAQAHGAPDDAHHHAASGAAEPGTDDSAEFLSGAARDALLAADQPQRARPDGREPPAAVHAHAPSVLTQGYLALKAAGVEAAVLADAAASRLTTASMARGDTTAAMLEHFPGAGDSDPHLPVARPEDGFTPFFAGRSEPIRGLHAGMTLGADAGLGDSASSMPSFMRSLDGHHLATSAVEPAAPAAAAPASRMAAPTSPPRDPTPLVAPQLLPLPEVSPHAHDALLADPAKRAVVEALAGDGRHITQPVQPPSSAGVPSASLPPPLVQRLRATPATTASPGVAATASAAQPPPSTAQQAPPVRTGGELQRVPLIRRAVHTPHRQPPPGPVQRLPPQGADRAALSTTPVGSAASVSALPPATSSATGALAHAPLSQALQVPATLTSVELHVPAPVSLSAVVASSPSGGGGGGGGVDRVFLRPAALATPGAQALQSRHVSSRMPLRNGATRSVRVHVAFEKLAVCLTTAARVDALPAGWYATSGVLSCVVEVEAVHDDGVGMGACVVVAHPPTISHLPPSAEASVVLTLDGAALAASPPVAEALGFLWSAATSPPAVAAELTGIVTLVAVDSPVGGAARGASAGAAAGAAHSVFALPLLGTTTLHLPPPPARPPREADEAGGFGGSTDTGAADGGRALDDSLELAAQVISSALHKLPPVAASDALSLEGSPPASGAPGRLAGGPPTPEGPVTAVELHTEPASVTAGSVLTAASSRASVMATGPPRSSRLDLGDAVRPASLLPPAPSPPLALPPPPQSLPPPAAAAPRPAASLATPPGDGQSAPSPPAAATPTATAQGGPGAQDAAKSSLLSRLKAAMSALDAATAPAGVQPTVTALTPPRPSPVASAGASPAPPPAVTTGAATSAAPTEHRGTATPPRAVMLVDRHATPSGRTPEALARASAKRAAAAATAMEALAALGASLQHDPDATLLATTEPDAPALPSPPVPQRSTRIPLPTPSPTVTAAAVRAVRGGRAAMSGGAVGGAGATSGPARLIGVAPAPPSPPVVVRGSVLDVSVASLPPPAAGTPARPSETRAVGTVAVDGRQGEGLAPGGTAAAALDTSLASTAHESIVSGRRSRRQRALGLSPGKTEPAAPATPLTAHTRPRPSSASGGVAERRPGLAMTPLSSTRFMAALPTPATPVRAIPQTPAVPATQPMTTPPPAASHAVRSGQQSAASQATRTPTSLSAVSSRRGTRNAAFFTPVAAASGAAVARSVVATTTPAFGGGATHLLFVPTSAQAAGRAGDVDDAVSAVALASVASPAPAPVPSRGGGGGSGAGVSDTPRGGRIAPSPGRTPRRIASAATTPARPLQGSPPRPDAVGSDGDTALAFADMDLPAVDGGSIAAPAALADSEAGRQPRPSTQASGGSGVGGGRRATSGAPVSRVSLGKAQRVPQSAAIQQWLAVLEAHGIAELHVPPAQHGVDAATSPLARTHSPLVLSGADIGAADVPGPPSQRSPAGLPHVSPSQARPEQPAVDLWSAGQPPAVAPGGAPAGRDSQREAPLPSTPAGAPPPPVDLASPTTMIRALTRIRDAAGAVNATLVPPEPAAAAAPSPPAATASSAGVALASPPAPTPATPPFFTHISTPASGPAPPPSPPPGTAPGSDTVPPPPRSAPADTASSLRTVAAAVLREADGETASTSGPLDLMRLLLSPEESAVLESAARRLTATLESGARASSSVSGSTPQRTPAPAPDASPLLARLLLLAAAGAAGGTPLSLASMATPAPAPAPVPAPVPAAVQFPSTPARTTPAQQPAPTPPPPTVSAAIPAAQAPDSAAVAAQSRLRAEGDDHGARAARPEPDAPAFPSPPPPAVRRGGGAASLPPPSAVPPGTFTPPHRVPAARDDHDSRGDAGADGGAAAAQPAPLFSPAMKAHEVLASLQAAVRVHGGAAALPPAAAGTPSRRPAREHASWYVHDLTASLHIPPLHVVASVVADRVRTSAADARSALPAMRFMPADLRAAVAVVNRGSAPVTVLALGADGALLPSAAHPRDEAGAPALLVASSTAVVVPPEGERKVGLQVVVDGGDAARDHGAVVRRAIPLPAAAWSWSPQRRALVTWLWLVNTAPSDVDGAVTLRAAQLAIARLPAPPAAEWGPSIGDALPPGSTCCGVRVLVHEAAWLEAGWRLADGADGGLVLRHASTVVVPRAAPPAHVTPPSPAPHAVSAPAGALAAPRHGSAAPPTKAAPRWNAFGSPLSIAPPAVAGAPLPGEAAPEPPPSPPLSPGLTFPARRVVFPPAATAGGGDVTVRIQLCNTALHALHATIRLQAHPSGAPLCFAMKRSHGAVTLKPRSYCRLPVTFTPPAATHTGRKTMALLVVSAVPDSRDAAVGEGGADALQLTCTALLVAEV
jgi:hypothetical protein